jgi:predicted ester cyclase
MTNTRAATVPQVINDLIAAYSAHDVDRMARLYCGDAVIAVNEFEITGDGIAAFWRAWFEAFPDVSSEVHRTVTDGPYVLLDWTETGTQVAPIRILGYDVPCKHRRLSWRGASLYRIGDSGIEHVRYFVDPMVLARQLMPIADRAVAAWQRYRALRTSLIRR